MPFQSAGSGFARGFTSTYAPRQQMAAQREQLDAQLAFRAKELQAEQQAAAAKQRNDRIQAVMSDAQNMQDKMLEGIMEAAKAGESDEILQSMAEQALSPAKVAQTTLFALRNGAMSAGATEDQVNMVIPDPNSYFEQRAALVESSLTAARSVAAQNRVVTLSPEKASAIGFPEGAIVQKKGEELKMLFDPTEDESQLESRVRLLIDSGVPEEFAKGIAGGRYAVSVHPISGERQVIDVFTGQRVGGIPDPQPEQEIPPIIPGDVQTGAATGFGGMIRNAVNIASSAIFATLPAEETQKATSAMTTLQTMTITAFSVALPGRDSNQLREQLAKLTVSPNSLFQGEPRAKQRIEDTLQLLRNEQERIKRDVLGANIDPRTRVDAQGNVSQIGELIRGYESLLEGFDRASDLKAIDDTQAIIDQARELMNSGDIAGAEELMKQVK